MEMKPQSATVQCAQYQLAKYSGFSNQHRLYRKQECIKPSTSDSSGHNGFNPAEPTNIAPAATGRD
jgi:hypothetical protein